MTDRRRPPAAASRILALGLSTSSLLGMTAWMGMASEEAEAPQTSSLADPAQFEAEPPPPTAPQVQRRIVYVIRRHLPATSSAPSAPARPSTISAASAPRAAAPRSQPAPKPRPARTQPQPTTQTQGS